MRYLLLKWIQLTSFGGSIPLALVILRRLTGRTFKVLNFKFVIHHGRIFFGKRPVKLTVSKNKKFPGYFTFTLNKVVYYIKFTLRGLIVYGLRGHKVFKTTVITRKKIVIKHPKKGKKEKKPKKGKKEKKPKKGKKQPKNLGKTYFLVFWNYLDILKIKWIILRIIKFLKLFDIHFLNSLKHFS